MYIVYILYSALKDNYYIGFTGDDIDNRLSKHNATHKGFTGKVADWKTVYRENYSEKTKAMKRELEIKKWKSRKRIVQLENKKSTKIMMLFNTVLQGSAS